MFIPEYSLEPNIQHLFIEDCRLECFIGAYDHERKQTQPVSIDCDVWVRQTQAIEDNLDNVLNYDLLVNLAKKVALSGHIDLQETLVERLAQAILALPNVELVRVQSRKLAAYPDVKAAGVEIWRQHPSFPHE